MLGQQGAGKYAWFKGQLRPIPLEEMLPRVAPKGDMQAMLSMAACLEDKEQDVRAPLPFKQSESLRAVSNRLATVL